MRRDNRFVSVLGLGLVLASCFGSSTKGPDAGEGAPQLDAGDAALIDASIDVAGDRNAPSDSSAEAACTPAGAPVTHTSDVTADETWASGIHLVPSSIKITGGARLTIGACSEVRLGPGASIAATTTAVGLDALGTSASPIRFVAQQAGTPWGAITVTAPAVASLAYVTLSGGGTGPHASAPFGGASLAGSGSDPARPVVLELQHVVVTGSAGLGIFLRGARLDPASVDLTVTGAGWFPVYLGAASAGDLPNGAYTGNAIDQILLQTFGVASYDDADSIVSDVTFHDLGVPYRVGTFPSSIAVGDGIGGHPPASLTLAAGVHVLFTPQGAGGTSQILVRAEDNGGTWSAQGALVIQGTSASPVVLDSAADAPAAADWQGLYFADLVDPRTSIAHAQILHAGGDSSAIGICGSSPAAPNGVAACAVVVLVDAPPQAFLSNSHLEAAPCGVYRGWTLTDVDFLSTNEFVAIPGCTQSSLPDMSGRCATCPTAP